MTCAPICIGSIVAAMLAVFVVEHYWPAMANFANYCLGVYVGACLMKWLIE